MKVETHCKKCCFSVWELNKQTGCTFNLIEIFEAKKQVEDRGEDGLVIFNTLCPRFRTDAWWDTHKENYTERLAFESRIEYVAFVIVTEKTKLSEVHDSLVSLSIQEPAPFGIYILNMFSRLGDRELLETVKQYTNNYLVNTIADPGFKLGDGIDFCLAYTKQNYILVTQAGKKIDSGFVKFVQQSTYRNFKIVGLLLIDEDNYLIDRRLYQIEKFNLMEDIVKKYPDFCEKWQNVSA